MGLELVLLRHGQSVWNAEKRFAGSSDVELTEIGIEQAREAGRLLKQRGYGFDLVYTSELRRARRTAQEALSQLDGNGRAVRASRHLNERNFGELEGMKFADAARLHGEDWGRAWLWDKRPPGGESTEELAARVGAFLRQDLEPAMLSGSRVLVVAHGHTIRMLDELFRGGVGEALESIPSAAPLVYPVGVEGGALAVGGRCYL